MTAATVPTKLWKIYAIHIYGDEHEPHAVFRGEEVTVDDVFQFWLKNKSDGGVIYKKQKIATGKMPKPTIVCTVDLPHRDEQGWKYGVKVYSYATKEVRDQVADALNITLKTLHIGYDVSDRSWIYIKIDDTV